MSVTITIKNNSPEKMILVDRISIAEVPVLAGRDLIMPGNVLELTVEAGHYATIKER